GVRGGNRRPAGGRLNRCRASSQDPAAVLTFGRPARHPPDNRFAASRIREERMPVSSIRHRLLAACQCCTEPFAATAADATAPTASGPRRAPRAPAAPRAAGPLYAPRIRAQAGPPRIDVHHHAAPPSWLAAMDVIGRTNPPLANWSVQKTLEDMDKGG